ncbi:MAG: DNA-directed RNA polymerase subunit D [Candidatus Poseidoniales archaeon]|nr:MAG: DNA-directed RNA polymerase subunit D [Candidatus Poseidoniales archaeon]
MVKVKIINENLNSIKILFTEADRSLLNAIRRTLMVDTPKMAIDTVRFELGLVEQDGETWESTGPIPDETVAQRLAMIPIVTRHDDFYFQDMCPSCKDLVEDQRGCPQCSVIYACKAFGTEEGKMIYAGDMKPMGDDSLSIIDEFKEIPITKLFKGQMIEFFATAIMGRGRDHTKWSPVCGVSFTSRKVGVIKNKSKSKILWDLDLEITEKDFKNGKLEDIEKVAILERELHHVGEGTEEMREFQDAIVIEEVPEEFILSFETDGSMTPRVAFEKATEELSARFENISQDIVSALN